MAGAERREPPVIGFRADWQFTLSANQALTEHECSMWKKRADIPLGVRGEKAAERFLRRQGYRLLGRRFQYQRGDIDLIFLDGQCVVFVEVKTRTTLQMGRPADAVDFNKQRKLTRLALIYLKQHRLLDHPARFDVVSVLWPDEDAQPQIEHFVNAFPAQGDGPMFA